MASGKASKFFNRILIAAIAVTLLIAWMAAGQYLLCRHGWKRLTEVTRISHEASR